MLYELDVSSGVLSTNLAPARSPSKGGGWPQRDDSGARNVHLTTIRTLDIKLAILLQTLASTPGCPNVGSMDFGERLTVVIRKRSVSWMS